MNSMHRFGSSLMAAALAVACVPAGAQTFSADEGTVPGANANTVVADRMSFNYESRIVQTLDPRHDPVLLARSGLQPEADPVDRLTVGTQQKGVARTPAELLAAIESIERERRQRPSAVDGRLHFLGSPLHPLRVARRLVVAP